MEAGLTVAHCSVGEFSKRPTKTRWDIEAAIKKVEHGCEIKNDHGG
jgi:hypothetical protein